MTPSDDVGARSLGVTSADHPTLAGRLAPHVTHRFDEARYAWWRPRCAGGGWRRRTVTWTRSDQLAQIIERLALLIDAGHPVAAAADRIVADGRGAIVAEFRAVANDLADGRGLAEALRAWARAAGCDDVGRLAAAVRRTASASALSAALHDQAGVLRRRAHQQRVRSFERRVRALWVAALAVVAASLVAALP